MMVGYRKPHVEEVESICIHVDSGKSQRLMLGSHPGTAIGKGVMAEEWEHSGFSSAQLLDLSVPCPWSIYHKKHSPSTWDGS
jgi:hypothetical protein